MTYHSPLSFCSGCKFVSNDTEFYYSGPYIAIEWNSSAYYLRYLPGHEQVIRTIFNKDTFSSPFDGWPRMWTFMPVCSSLEQEICLTQREMIQ